MVNSTALRKLGTRWHTIFMVMMAFLASHAPVRSAELRWAIPSGNQSSNSIVVSADQIATWQESNQQIFLLSGKVLVEHGLVNLRLDRGVLWVDQDHKKKTGVYKLRLYAEGNIYAEKGARSEQAQTGLLELETRGAVKFRSSPNSKIVQQAFPKDELFLRSVKLWQSAPASLPTDPEVVDNQVRQSPSKGNAVANRGVTHEAQKPPELPPLDRTTPRSVSDASVPVSQIDPNIQLVQGLGSPLPPGNATPAPFQNGGPAPLPPPPGMAPVGPIPIGSGPTLNPIGRGVSIRPRSSFQGLQVRNFPLPSGETAVVVSSGIIITVTNSDGKGGILDIEADRLVFWTTGNTQQILEDLQKSKSQDTRRLEFYLSGNVEIRTKVEGETRLLRADEVYYDVNRHVAVATQANLEISEPRLINSIHVSADELFQINQNLFRASQSSINASALPWDPGMSINIQDATLENKKIIRKTIFGFPIIDRNTGQPIEDTQRYVRGRNMFLFLEDIPVFYLPFVQGDAEDPLGPLENVGIGVNGIFGFQLYTTWDVHDLIGVTAAPGTKWRLNLDYLSDRGPGLGTTYTYRTESILGIPGRYVGDVRAWGIYDTGIDVIGGGRGENLRIGRAPGDVIPVTHPDWRGRFLTRFNGQDLPYGFTTQAQLHAISDRNFLEQYFYQEFLNEETQNTFLYVKQQQDNWAWTGLGQARLQDWLTQEQWYPRFDGYLLGAKLFDVVTYNGKASVGFGNLETASQPPPPFEPTDVNIQTGRFDLWQEASIPFTLGAFKVSPYAVVDLSYYTDTITDDNNGRFYGAGGVRATLPMSRLYPGVQSDLFNLNGIYHKVVFSGNYYNAYSSSSFLDYPQLDRMNDPVSDYSIRNMYVNVPYLFPGQPYILSYPIFDPQTFAIRKLVNNAIDTRDDVEVIQLGARQRWQTKRGFPGRQHIIDWMTLDLTGSIFPRADRDNFGEYLAFLQYDWLWNIGDRTSLASSGWYSPIDNGPRVFNIGGYYNRPDGTQLYLGYRQIDPVQSKAVIGSIGYNFSKKYSMAFTANYDFGVDSQVSTFVVTRTGKDLRVSAGFSYDSILNNLGFVFEVVPNIFPSSIRSPATPAPLANSVSNNGF